MQTGRSDYQQGGYQVVGWLITAGIGAFSGLIIGILYKVLNTHEINENINDFFNDAALFSYPKPQNILQFEEKK